MPLKIVRNDIVNMNTEAIVNTANDKPTVGTGCDYAIYKASGYDKLLSYRKEHIGEVEEGEAFITPAFGLKSKYIIHAVSPFFMDGQHGEEEKLRSCYRKSLKLAKEYGVSSISFPLISTGGFGYPKEEGMRIAVDEMNAFLLANDMLIYLVVFDDKTTGLGRRIHRDLQSYIDQNYVDNRLSEEFSSDALLSSIGAHSYHKASPRTNRKDRDRRFFGKNAAPSVGEGLGALPPFDLEEECAEECKEDILPEYQAHSKKVISPQSQDYDEKSIFPKSQDFDEEIISPKSQDFDEESISPQSQDYDDILFDLEEKLSERMKHMSDTYSEYLLYLIEKNGLKNADVWRNAIVDKKVFSKIKNNPAYHPNKKTALCLCIGARLNIDEAKDLLARAGYALSPCDKTDIIFSYFLEKGIYDMIELDIQLESNGEPCIIS